MKFIPSIKTLWLRRCVMVVVLPFAALYFAYLGVRTVVSDFGVCWNFRHPEA